MNCSRFFFNVLALVLASHAPLCAVQEASELPGAQVQTPSGYQQQLPRETELSQTHAVASELDPLLKNSSTPQERGSAEWKPAPTVNYAEARQLLDRRLMLSGLWQGVIWLVLILGQPLPLANAFGAELSTRLMPCMDVPEDISVWVDSINTIKYECTSRQLGDSAYCSYTCGTTPNWLAIATFGLICIGALATWGGYVKNLAGARNELEKLKQTRVTA